MYGGLSSTLSGHNIVPIFIRFFKSERSQLLEMPQDQLMDVRWQGGSRTGNRSHLSGLLEASVVRSMLIKLDHCFKNDFHLCHCWKAGGEKNGVGKVDFKISLISKNYFRMQIFVFPCYGDDKGCSTHMKAWPMVVQGCISSWGLDEATHLTCPVCLCWHEVAWDDGPGIVSPLPPLLVGPASYMVSPCFLFQVHFVVVSYIIFTLVTFCCSFFS